MLLTYSLGLYEELVVHSGLRDYSTLIVPHNLHKRRSFISVLLYIAKKQRNNFVSFRYEIRETVDFIDDVAETIPEYNGIWKGTTNSLLSQKDCSLNCNRQIQNGLDRGTYRAREINLGDFAWQPKRATQLPGLLSAPFRLLPVQEGRQRREKLRSVRLP